MVEQRISVVLSNPSSTLDEEEKKKKVVVHGPSMASGIILAGLGLATIGFGTRFIIRSMPTLGKKMAEAVNNVGQIDGKALAHSRYYKGGFEPKMTKREAGLILNLSPNADPVKVKAAYKKMMLANHPDRGGSPYISAKLSEAKDLLDK
ncbi:mitochondrial import inner membrane translocase subunit TIM14-like isoform X2 [Panulirus ornatus]|uniref:mitochondrial import inner membrane translocase subunit TIM14-like isoform X2 n=1 Tax=Panulirus ornatus TaxID=150431 RepID=UPI003A851D62